MQYSSDENFFLQKFSDSFEEFMVNSSQRRNYTVSFVQSLFMTLLNKETFKSIIECGASNARHTKKFSIIPGLMVHAFEPNPFMSIHWHDILKTSNVVFNTAALSNVSGVVKFNIPTINGKTTDGISSFTTHALYKESIQLNVPTITAESYIRLHNIAPESLALWIDVEGHADTVLNGFGSFLDEVPCLLVEVETYPHFDREPSLNHVIDILKNTKMTPVARDWMNKGQYNILFLNESTKKLVMNEIDSYKNKIIEYLSEEKKIINIAKTYIKKILK